MARRRKKKDQTSKEEAKELINAPHSFVIHRGPIGHNLEHLLKNVRQIMEPFTASKLKIRKKNTVKDFVSISSYLNVSHIIVFTQSPLAPYMRLCRTPKGPTLTYKIIEYSLSHDVVAGQKRPHVNPKLFKTAPLLVLNGFSNRNQDQRINLQTSMWRNMFPSIDIHCVQLSKIRRCLLLNLDNETNQIDLRHYAIKVQPVGLSKMVKTLFNAKKIPDLGQFHSVEEALQSQDLEVDSDNEETFVQAQVTLSQTLNDKRGNMLSEKSSIKLYELGPRMLLELVKVENGIMSGEVLYHSYVHKTQQEIHQQKIQIQNRNSQKESRRQQQEQNVKRKQMDI